VSAVLNLTEKGQLSSIGSMSGGDQGIYMSRLCLEWRNQVLEQVDAMDSSFWRLTCIYIWGAEGKVIGRHPVVHTTMACKLTFQD